MEVEALLDGLDPAQRLAVTTDAAPLAIIAPAGSGKTRVLTRRIARRALDGSADPRHVLAITFTRRAAGELVRRLADLGLRDRPTAGTFHGVALQVLRQRWEDLGRQPPTLVADPRRLLAELLERTPRAAAKVDVTGLATEIAWARARLVPPERYEVEARRHGRRLPGALVADLFAAYTEAKRARRLVDFDDLLALCAAEVRRDPVFAEVVRWRFRHLFVDEFQDVNPLQVALLEALRGGRPDLCVVGDPNQAIYGWNGADASWLRDFPDHYPGGTVVHLSTSYRSTPQVLDVAAVALAAAGASGGVDPAGGDGPPVEVVAFEDEAAEAPGIAALLRTQRRPGARWASCAVLTRTNAHAAALVAGLRAAGLPCRMRGTGVAVGPAALQRLREGAARHPGPGGLLGLLEDLEDDAADERPGDPLVPLVRSFLADSPDASVDDFVGWVTTGGAGDDEPSGDGVDVLTFHAAKGLEWPVVVVAGLERGLVPHVSAVGAAARAEEARLLYVALTRAEEHLTLTWTRRRASARRPARSPSPWLPALERAATPPPPAPPPADRPWRVDRPAPPADPVLVALHGWRRSAARAAGLPEQAVCTDAALSAIARERPSSVEALAAIPEVGRLAARRLGPRLLAVLAAADG